MKYLVSIIFIITGLLCYSCGEDVQGEDTPPKFSPDFITFDNGTNTKIIKNQNKQDWNFNQFYINGTLVSMDGPEITLQYQEGKEHKIWNVTDVRGPWFTLKKIDKETIEIHVEPTSENRQFSFFADRGNSHQKITIIQSNVSN